MARQRLTCLVCGGTLTKLSFLVKQANVDHIVRTVLITLPAYRTHQRCKRWAGKLHLALRHVLRGLERENGFAGSCPGNRDHCGIFANHAVMFGHAARIIPLKQLSRFDLYGKRIITKKTMRFTKPPSSKRKRNRTSRPRHEPGCIKAQQGQIPYHI
jgi:hypothetical protein